VGQATRRPEDRFDGVVLAVDAEPGPVVLEHPVDQVAVPQRGPDIGVVPAPIAAGDGVRYHASGSAVMTRSAGFSVWARNHQCHPGPREPRVGPLQVLDHRQPVHDGEARDPVSVVHRGAEGDERAAVVAGHGEPLVTQKCHQLDDVRTGQRPDAVRDAARHRQRR
jgi:hypothetical protein